jgi:hypothetical protein
MAITGKFDDKEYFLWGLKEPNYIMMMMATRGLLLANNSCGMQKRRCTEGVLRRFWLFQFQCPYGWYHKYRHAVSNHNNLRHLLPSIEHTIVRILVCTHSDIGKCFPCIPIHLSSWSCPNPPAVSPQAGIAANKE